MTAALLSLLTIVGTWRYAGFRYEDRQYPIPNPDLELLFTFREDGVSRLYWHRKNEPGFCERTADYRLDGNMLWQKNTWVNPANDGSCASDPDMQPGRETTTPIQLSQNDMAFVLELNGKEFLYRLTREQNVPALNPLIGTK